MPYGTRRCGPQNPAGLPRGWFGFVIHLGSFRFAESRRLVRRIFRFWAASRPEHFRNSCNATHQVGREFQEEVSDRFEDHRLAGSRTNPPVKPAGFHGFRDGWNVASNRRIRGASPRDLRAMICIRQWDLPPASHGLASFERLLSHQPERASVRFPEPWASAQRLIPNATVDSRMMLSALTHRIHGESSKRGPRKAQHRP